MAGSCPGRKCEVSSRVRMSVLSGTCMLANQLGDHGVVTARGEELLDLRA